MGSCAAPSAKGDDKFITTDYLQQCQPDHLLSDACLNIYTGAYYLAQAFKKWGVSWDAVGAYNAGFKKTPRQAARRYEYAKKIHYYYTAIKASKRTSSKDQKIAMN